MAGYPFATCKACGKLTLNTLVFIGEGNRLVLDGNIVSQCDCGGVFQVPNGTWTGTDRGVLYEPLSLSPEKLRIALEIIQPFNPTKRFTHREIQKLDRTFMERADTDEKLFSELSRWQKTKRVGYVLTLLCAVITAVSGAVLAFDALLREQTARLPQKERQALEQRRSELEQLLLEQRQQDPKAQTVPAPKSRSTEPPTTT